MVNPGFHSVPAGPEPSCHERRLLVVASVRHEDTEYDSLLMSGVSRQDAHDRIRAAVDRTLAAWAQA